MERHLKSSKFTASFLFDASDTVIGEVQDSTRSFGRSEFSRKCHVFSVSIYASRHIENQSLGIRARLLHSNIEDVVVSGAANLESHYCAFFIAGSTSGLREYLWMECKLSQGIPRLRSTYKEQASNF